MTEVTMTDEPHIDLPDTHATAVNRKAGVVEIEQRAVPRVEPGRVIVEVSYCGVCGSDLHLTLEGWGTRGSVEGHEYSGVIVAVGDEVEGWTVGERIVCGASPKCGTCDACLAGLPSQCSHRTGIMGNRYDGAFAQYVSLDARALVSVPETLDLRTAALAEPLAVSLHAITRSGIAVGESAMIFGAGPIGALLLSVLVAEGIGPVTVVEPNETRQRLARQLGADVVLHPSDLTTYSLVEPDRVAEHAVSVVFECSGHRSAMEAAPSQLKRGGRLMLVGAGIDPPSFDPNRLILNELTVSGVFIYDADGFERAMDWLDSGRLRTDLLIEPDDVPLDGMLDAMLQIVAGLRPGKVMVVPRLAGNAS